MATPTSRLRAIKIAPGSDLNVWGDKLNTQVFDLFDEAIAGVESITVTTDVTLTSANYASDQSRNRVLRFIGSPVAPRVVTIPSVESWYLIDNTTTQPITVKTSGDAGAVIVAQSATLIYCTGSAVTNAAPSSFAGARLRAVGTPTAADDAAVKSYVDTFDAHRSAGGYRLTSLGTPSGAADAATKGYVDTATANRSAGGFRIADLAAPVDGTDAVNKTYADAAQAAALAAIAAAQATASTTLSDAQAAAAQATTAATNANNAAADVTQQVEDLAELLSDGPVASVNGQGGTVVLTASDVGAAATSHTHIIGNVTGLQAALDAKAGTANATGSVAGLMSASDKTALDAATSTATAVTLVRRDGSGNFAAGTITAALAGNASTATALAAGTDKTKLDSAVQTVNAKSGTSITLVPSDIGAAPRTWTYRTTTTTAVPGDRIAASTVSAAWTLTLPLSPSAGNAVEVMDAGGTFATNNLTIARNGATIMSLSEDMTVAVNNVSFVLVYNGSTWRVA